MWSGPRTVSTALMRAWENRADTAVVDEPLYAFYLVRTGIDHPGRDEIIASMSNEWRVVLDRLTRRPVPGGKTVFYAKHMTHHLLPEVDRGALAALRHAHLIRDPAELLASYAKVRVRPTWPTSASPQQAEIFRRVRRAGAGLRGTCWSSRSRCCGRCARHWTCRSTRPCCRGRRGRATATGCGAPHWYAGVWASTGFGRYRPPAGLLPPHLAMLAEQCRPYYERLHDHRLTAAAVP